MSELSIVVSKLRPLLEEYSLKLKDVEDGIKQHGIISLDICAKCSQRNIVNILKINESSRKYLDSFLAWIRENEVRELNSSGEVLAFRSTKKEVEGVEGNIPLLEMSQALKPSTEKVCYDYKISVDRLKSKGFAPLLKHAFFFP